MLASQEGDDMSRDIRPGVSAMSAYVPAFRVRLRDWCEWTGNSWDKIQVVVGHSFRVPGPHENVYTMAANAVLRLIMQNDIDPRMVGFLGLGTESSTDNAAGAVIVRGMVDRALESLGKPRLSRHCEVPEFKHACLGGIYALKAAVRYVMCDAGDRLAIVISGDVAEYERGSSGEQTQGAGAVAMLVSSDAKLFDIDLAHAGSASDYRGPDFRKPLARYFHEAYAPGVQRLSDFPVFSGKYSTYSYIDETVHAVEAMLRKLNVSAGKYYHSVHSLFFHRPYDMMPVQAMSFLYVRGMARGDHYQDELRALCEEAGVGVEAVFKEAQSAPDLFATVSAEGARVGDPYQHTSAVASVLRKKPEFRELLGNKMVLGTNVMRDLGNLYSAALPAWLAAGFEDAAERELELAGRPMVAVGYGSGDAAEAIPISAVPGWQKPAHCIALKRALGNAIDLTREQYEALHDGRDVSGLSYAPRGEFVITHVGDRHDAAFQDLGVEYYAYVS
jgi:hydroxymethylglutaryl-CoA synthase